MTIPYDTSPKAISEVFPSDWVGWLGWPSQPVEVVDADVATVSGAADKVFRVGGDNPWLLLMEFLSGRKPDAPERLHWHRTLIAHRHKLLVRSVLLLLRPEADGPGMTGLYEEGFPREPPEITFRYRVVRLWEIPAEALLAGGLGLALYAPIAKVDPEHLVDVVRTVRQRVDAERPQDGKELLAAMYILMGLRYDEAMIQMVQKEVHGMEESITYQEILHKGENKGRLADAREVVQLLGAKRWGSPEENALRVLNSISDIARLHQMCVRVSQVNSWMELLEGGGN